MNYWKELGLGIWENGYTVIPIYAHDSDKVGAGKRPVGKDWEKTINSKEEIEEWARRFKNNGIGLLTKYTPAVDIDIYDRDASDHMSAWVEENLGFAPCRIGRDPKKLFLFRTDEPFTKVKSAVWEDDFGEKHAVEVLADGQQFVAYGIHPETKKEYYWVGHDNPLNTAAELDLETITLDQARSVASEFDRYAKEQGWTMTRRPINGSDAIDLADDDDWASMADIQKWDGTYDDLRDIVMKYPNPEDYHSWITVLAALQVSCRDQEEAKEIACDWSKQASNYDGDAFEAKWEEGFHHTAGKLVTLGTIIKTVRDLEVKEVEEKKLEFREGFESCTDYNDWCVWSSDFKKVPVFGHDRKMIVNIAAKKYHQLVGDKLDLGSKKALLGFDPSTRETPSWIRNYVFSESNDCFVNRKTHDYISKGAFDTANATKSIVGDDKYKASQFASEIYPVPVVHDGMYYPAMHGDLEGSSWKMAEGLPGTDFFYDFQGRMWLNTFDPESLPVPADELSKYDRKAVEIIKDFFIVLFPNEKERGYVMDWLAWVVQNPTKRINYSLLIRGAHGSGKTTIGILMSNMLGRANVGYVSNTVMNGRFSEWAEGHILKIVEEIYDKGDRYSAVERQKEFITNDRFMVEPKGRKAKEVVNTSSKMMFTNHFNALPLDENQRRYLVVSTQAENHLDMERVYGSAAERSRFFKDVYRALENHSPAIKKFFIDWDISPKFDHKGHAPQDTEAFAVMADASDDGIAGTISQMLMDGTAKGVNQNLIFVPHLRDVLMESSDGDIPKTNRLKNLLMELGFKPGGLLKFEGEAGRVYVRKRVRGAFDDAGKLNSKWAQETLKKHNANLEQDSSNKPSPFDDEDV